MYPGLHDREHLEPGYSDDDYAQEQIWDWRDQMLGALLPPDEAHDYRRHDLLMMETYGQGIYDTADPRHPLRWFDRDDLHEQYKAALAYARLPEKEKAAHTEQAMERVGKLLVPHPKRP
jgi:hypothetical protein